MAVAQQRSSELGDSQVERVPGMSAEAYLMQSLVKPDAYVVEGFQPGQMRPDLAEALTQQQLDDLVAFLLTLR